MFTGEKTVRLPNFETIAFDIKRKRHLAQNKMSYYLTLVLYRRHDSGLSANCGSVQAAS